MTATVASSRLVRGPGRFRPRYDERFSIATRGCRFPGCGLPFGQGHHLQHWARGGPTTLSNLTLLCRRHHRAVHEEGYTVECARDGSLLFRRPDGRTLTDMVEPRGVPPEPIRALIEANVLLGVRIDPRAITAGSGQRLDVAYAIDVLHPLGLASRP